MKMNKQEFIKTLKSLGKTDEHIQMMVKDMERVCSELDADAFKKWESGEEKMRTTIERLGFKVINTDDGCSVYQYKFANGNYIWLTEETGTAIPIDENTEISAGYYSANDKVLGSYLFNNFKE